MGLGMHSVSDASRNAVRKGDNATCPDKYNVPVSTHGPGVRPMSKIRKAKPAKQNTVFHSDRAGKLENADRKAVRDLKRLKSLKGTLQYSVLRTELLARHPSLLKHIAGFELSSRNW